MTSIVKTLRGMIERGRRDGLAQPYVEGLMDAYVAAGGKAKDCLGGGHKGEAPAGATVWALDLLVKGGIEPRRLGFIQGRDERQLTQVMDYILKNAGRIAREAAKTMPDPFEIRSRCGGCLANVICPEHGVRAVEARRPDFAFTDGPRRGFFTTSQNAGVKARGLEDGFCGDGPRRARFFVHPLAGAKTPGKARR